jgi:hypothetical protein
MLDVGDARNLVQAQATKASDKLNLEDISIDTTQDGYAHTHCWSVSTSSMLTPMRRVPRKCHAVSRGRF